MIPNSVDFEKIFYLFITKNKNYFNTVPKDFFESTELSFLYDLTKKFFKKFNEIPSKKQLLAISKLDKFKSKISENMINIIFEESIDSYDAKWIKETCEAWIIWKSMDKSLIDTIQYVKTVQVNPDNVKDVVEKVKSLINERNNIIFDEDLGKNFFDEACHIPEKDSLITTSHKWLDELTGGYRLKSLVCYLGETNIGKSIWLANDAVNYVKSNYNVVLISAEMSDTDFIHRIGSNLLDIKIDEYEKTTYKENIIKTKLSNLQNGFNEVGQLYVKEVPTSQFSVPDIENYVKELEIKKGLKIDVVIIDYINILKNYRNPNTEDTYNKVKQIAEDLRGIAVKNKWLIITATQTNRSAFNSSDLSLNNVSESTGLSSTADFVFGIIQTDDMYLKKIYWLKLLKARRGKGKGLKCKYNIDYSYMRLIETDELQNSTI